MHLPLQLFKKNATVLLFPGGIREVYHRKNEDYQLFWFVGDVFFVIIFFFICFFRPEKVDFVRMAALTDAIIVPFAAIGNAIFFCFLERTYLFICRNCGFC